MDFCKSRARDMWREMFELRTNGRSEAAARLANMVMQKRQLEKRDTIADFWARRLHDMQLRDDPVEKKEENGETAEEEPPKKANKSKVGRLGSYLISLASASPALESKGPSTDLCPS